jgi:hypothetical protein
MSIDRLGKELEALGVSGKDVRCLLLLPQVYVGWVSQRRNLPALEALLDTTARRARFGWESLSLARGWLFEQPTRAQFQSGFALLRVLRRAPAKPLIDSADVLEAIIWASRAALLDREPSRLRPGPVSAVAQRAMLDLEAWLEVEMGDIWTDILADCEDEAPSTAGRPLPRFALLSDPEPQRVVPPEVEDEEERSAVLARSDDAAAPVSAPFPLVRRRA